MSIYAVATIKMMMEEIVLSKEEYGGYDDKIHIFRRKYLSSFWEKKPQEHHQRNSGCL